MSGSVGSVGSWRSTSRPASSKKPSSQATRAQVEATLPLLAGEGGSRPFGYMSSVEWQRFTNWAFENGV
ncbi:MAG: hypothetical protein ACKORM_07095, partial [Solirubrobacterales bacterium]